MEEASKHGSNAMGLGRKACMGTEASVTSPAWSLVTHSSTVLM